jgi:hypothetical protein
MAGEAESRLQRPLVEERVVVRGGEGVHQNAR